MSNIDKIVDVQISRQTQSVAQAGFGVPLIIGPNAPFANTEVRTYFSLSAVLEDFAEVDAEYIMASKIFGQDVRPEKIKIGLTTTPVAQVVTLTPNVASQAVQDYEVTINGQVFSFESDADPTAAEVVTGLIALINAASQPVTASGTTTLVLTADVAGESFTYASSTNLPAVLTTPNNGIASDIQNAVNIDNEWYFLLTTATSDLVVKEAAKKIETLSKLYMFINADSDVMTGVDTDLVSELGALNYDRTGVFYTKANVASRGDAGLVGRVAPLDPGSETWAFKTIRNVVADTYLEGEEVNLDAKNANYYTNKAGLDITINGKNVSGEYIDVMRFIDFLTARMGEKVFGTIAASDKVPFTDAGIAIIESDMRSVLELGIRVGGISEFTVTVPKAVNISAADKAARVLRGMNFTAKLTGAIHKTEIRGTVTF